MIAIMIGGMIGLTILSVSSYRHYKTSMKIQEQLNRNAEILDRANELFRAYLETGDQSYLEYVDEELEKIQS